MGAFAHVGVVCVGYYCDETNNEREMMCASMHPNSLHWEYGLRGGGGGGLANWNGLHSGLREKYRQQSKERGEMIITSLPFCAELLVGKMLLEMMDTLFPSAFITGYVHSQGM